MAKAITNLKIGRMSNKYDTVLNYCIEQDKVYVHGCYSLLEFQVVADAIIKDRTLNTVVFDHTILKFQEDFMEAIKYLKAHLNNKVRIIVIYPELEDETIIQQLLVFNIYDIVNPKIDKELDELEQEKFMIEQIKWALSQPVEFSKVMDKLLLSNLVPVQENEEEPEIVEEKKEKVNFFAKFNRDKDEDVVIAFDPNKICEEKIKKGMIGFVGAKGGVGNTVVSTTLANQYAVRNRKAKVAIVDFSLNGGNVAEKYGIKTPIPNIHEYIGDLIQAKREGIELQYLQDKLVEYCKYSRKNHIYILASSYDSVYRYLPEDVSEEELEYVCEYILLSLFKTFDVIFIDTGKSKITEQMVLKHSNHVFIVGDGKIASFHRILSKFNELNKKCTVSVIINKVYNAIDNKHIKALSRRIPKKIIHKVPLDSHLRDDNLEYGMKNGLRFRNALWNSMKGILR